MTLELNSEKQALVEENNDFARLLIIDILESNAVSLAALEDLFFKIVHKTFYNIELANEKDKIFFRKDGLVERIEPLFKTFEL